MHWILLPFLLFLTACGSWPDVGGPTLSRDASWPTLQPLSELIAEGAVTPASNDDAARLAARAAALRARAEVLRSDASDMESLRRRLR